MNPSYDDINKDFSVDMRTHKKAIKEEILDETFRKAEILKGLRPIEKKEVTKKPFLKLGIVLIIITIISLVAINYTPWIYIKYDAENGIIQEFIHRDLKDGHYYKEFDYIFESPCANCSNNSKNFIGLSKDDFTNIPKITFYGFIILFLLGIIFIIFEIIERKRNFSIKIVTLIHSTFAAATLTVNMFVIFTLIKFFSSNFLLYLNRSFIEVSGINNIILIFPVPIFIIFISLISIIIAINIMKINFLKFEKKLISEKTHSTLSYLNFGVKK